MGSVKFCSGSWLLDPSFSFPLMNMVPRIYGTAFLTSSHAKTGTREVGVSVDTHVHNLSDRLHHTSRTILEVAVILRSAKVFRSDRWEFVKGGVQVGVARTTS